MANYRQIHTQIWRDNWFLDLEADEKLLFIYLFSNDNSNLAGLYELHEKIIVLETGLAKERIHEIIAKFEADKKVLYKDGIVWIVNMQRYHSNAGEKVRRNIELIVEGIPDCYVKQQYCIANEIEPKNTLSENKNTLSHSKSKSKLKSKSKTEEEEEDEAQPETPNGGTFPSSDKVSSVCEYYKLKTGKLETKDATKLQELTVAYRLPDIRNAIDHMTAYTERPNPGYLQKVLDGWFAERKIRKVYS